MSKILNDLKKGTIDIDPKLLLYLLLATLLYLIYKFIRIKLG